jgi:ankyrin repeat protein
MSYSENIFSYNRVPTLFALTYFAFGKDKKLRQDIEKWSKEGIGTMTIEKITSAVSFLNDPIKIDDVLENFRESLLASAPYQTESHCVLKDKVALLELFKLQGRGLGIGEELRDPLDSEFAYFRPAFERKPWTACYDYTSFFLKHLIKANETASFIRVCDAVYFQPEQIHFSMAFEEGNRDIADFVIQRSFIGLFPETDMETLCELAIANGHFHMFEFVEKLGYRKSPIFLQGLLVLALISHENETVQLLIEHINKLIVENKGKAEWDSLENFVQETSKALSKQVALISHEDKTIKEEKTEENSNIFIIGLNQLNAAMENFLKEQEKPVMSFGDRKTALELFFRTNEWKALQHLMGHKEKRLCDILSKKGVSELQQDKRIRDFLIDALYQAVRISSPEIVRFCLFSFALYPQSDRTFKLWKVLHEPLELACRFGKRDIIRHFLNFIDTKKPRYREYLKIASKEGYPEILEDLFQLEKEVPDELLSAILDNAVKFGHLDTVRYLIEERSADLNHTVAFSLSNVAQDEPEEVSLLDLAISSGNVELYDYLLARDVQPKLAFHEQLAVAAQAGSLAMVQRLLEKEDNKIEKSDINTFVKEGKTALAFAVKNGNLQIIELLIDKGADPLLASEDSVENEIPAKATAPFVLAAGLENTEVIMLFLSKIKNLDWEFLQGAVETAIICNRLCNLKILCKKLVASFNTIKDTEKRAFYVENYVGSFLNTAAEHTCDLSIFQHLVSLLVDFDRQIDSEYSTLLHAAIKGSQGEKNPQRELRKAVVLAYLLSRGAKIDAQKLLKDEQGNPTIERGPTPLQKAIELSETVNNRMIVELLMQAGASAAELPSDYVREPENSPISLLVRAILEKFSDAKSEDELITALGERSVKRVKHN